MDEEYPLKDAVDLQIIMHREAHFGGQFDVMLDYYKQGRKGVQPEFEPNRIQELSDIEKGLQENLATLFLSGSDAEKVARSREMYKELRSLYESNRPEMRIPRLIADLILSEDPEAIAEIAALSKERISALSALIQLIRSEDLHDPLFPGYGFAPNLAIKCLGDIGDKRAIITLFESIGTGDFFDDNLALDALKVIGEPAKAFLLKVLHGKPLTEDNEKAAIALLAFKDDPEVSSTSLKLLQDSTVRKDPVLSTYLALACEGLKEEAERAAYRSLASDSATSKTLRLDMETVVKQWKD
ncbi:MAG: hypothetical protein LLG04_08515 [Parachlamydia sp.]|nr:hypothetical protein [Parachlamydia sp.]